MSEQEKKLIEQRKINVRLEKDLEKVKLDLNNVKNRTGKYFYFKTLKTKMISFLHS